MQERTLANALKDAGYETAITGKWHLGEFEPAYLPTARGFDHHSGDVFGRSPDATQTEVERRFAGIEKLFHLR